MRRFALLLLAALVSAQEDEGAGGEKEASDGGLGALAGLDWKAKPIDFKKVDRTIRKLPEIKSEKPLYALFLFGPEGETRVWVVLDKSAKDKKAYDVLYLDRNADRDLSGEDERIEGKAVEGRDPPSVRFEIGDFLEPGTDVLHREFVITSDQVRADSGAIDDSLVGFEMKWGGGPKVRKDLELLAFGSSRVDAPIFVPGTERPFEFEQFLHETLKRGKENDLKILIGSRGDRPGTFCHVDETFLPEGERVLVQLVCKDASGKERKLTAELKERAEGGIYHGPVRIPKDAKPGPAILRVRLPESSAYESFTTDLPVTIE